MKIRLPKKATCQRDMEQYYVTRARQMHHEGYQLAALNYHANDNVMIAEFQRDNHSYYSFFIPETAKGQGLFRKYYQGQTMVTMDECDLVSFFQKHDIPYVMAGTTMLQWEEYHLVSDFYGNGYAERTKAFFMNHIDEGISILKDIGATEQAMRAFCLHPLLQDDAHCLNHLAFLQRNMTSPDALYIVALAMEYRSVANEYLSRKTKNPEGIRLSPLKEVNDMLIADKIQNCKDFELYHKGSIPNSDRLSEYFNEWFEALGVTQCTYERFKTTLPTYPIDVTLP